MEYLTNNINKNYFPDMTTATYSSHLAFMVIKHLSTIVVLVREKTTNQNTVSDI